MHPHLSQAGHTSNFAAAALCCLALKLRRALPGLPLEGTLRLLFTTAGGARKPQALKAFASWLRLKSGCLLEGAVLAQHHLTQAALQASGLHLAGTGSLQVLCTLPAQTPCSCWPGHTAVSRASPCLPRGAMMGSRQGQIGCLCEFCLARLAAHLGA